MQTETSFPARLGTLLAIDVVVTIADSYIPLTVGAVSLSPIRALVAVVQFGLMAWTMGITVQYVLNDY